MRLLVGAKPQHSMNLRPVSAKKQNAFQMAALIIFKPTDSEVLALLNHLVGTRRRGKSIWFGFKYKAHA